MIRVVHPDFLPIPDPGVKKAPDPGYRIRNTGKTEAHLQSSISSDESSFFLFFWGFRPLGLSPSSSSESEP